MDNYIEIKSICTNSDNNTLVYKYNNNFKNYMIKLIKCNGLNNISLIDDNAIPIPLKSINQVMQLYCDSMKDIYYKFHNSKIEAILKEIEFETNFIKLITLIVNETILIRGIPKAIIYKSLEEHSILIECYDKLTVPSLSKEGIAKHTETLRKLVEEHEKLLVTSPLSYWTDSLIVFRDKLAKRPEFIKLPQHYTLPSFEDTTSPDSIADVEVLLDL